MGSVTSDGALSQDDRPVLESDAMQILEERRTTQVSYDNATVLNSSRDKTVIDNLKAFISGAPIKVQWYHQMRSDIGDSSLTTTISFMSNSVNTSLMLIKDMELMLTADMEYVFDEETSQSSITGTAALYPGFTPAIGDVFLYRITQGDIGIFKVSNNPKRLSIRNNTSYTIDFSLVKMLTDEDINALEERLRETMYFDKQRFLHTDGGLMTEQEVVDLAYLEKKVTYLESMYAANYYNKGLNTLMQSEDVFDPYVTHFFKRAISSYANGKYINTPSGSDIVKYWERSLYAHLLGEGVMSTPIMRSWVRECRYGGWSSLITMLQERRVVELVPDDVYGEMVPADQELVGDYISPGILSLDALAVSDFDKLVTLYINDKALAYVTWKQLADAVNALPKEEGFYKIPIYIYLGRMLINALQSGASINLVDENTQPYVNIPFTSLDVLDGVVSMETIDNPILAVVDASGIVHNLDDNLVIYGIGEVDVDISDILLGQNLENVDGQWFLVARNSLTLT